MSWSHVLAPISLALGVAFIAWASWPTRKHNRRVALKQPDPRCERFPNIQDPPTRSIP